VLADAEMMLGRTEGARQWYAQAAQLSFGAPGGIYLRRWALSGAMFCAALLGDLDGAAEQSRSLASSPAHEAVVHEHPRQLAEQWIVAQRGDPAGAARALRSMADVAYEAGRYGDVVRALLDATRLIGDARPAAAWLEHHDLDVDGGLFPAVIDWIIALDRRDDDALAAIAERFLLEADVSVLAAEAASSSWTIARERGAPERLVAARGRRAQELRAMFGPGLTPSLAVTPIDLPLSGREREIATLVASGRTSREVAEELVIGVRTVESHLARIYGKLGIRSRAELANALGLEAAQT
jgi:ATP/maltotriose-dependent transcriptional regulator MalT